MNQKTRLLIAVIFTLILAVTATTVWAGNNAKEGSLPGKIHHGRGHCNNGLINMGDATFKMIVDDRVICSFEVTRTKLPNVLMGGAPEGTEFRSDGFIVEGGPEHYIVAILEVCFAYSPQDEAKHAQIYGVFGTESAILPSVAQGKPRMLCTATSNINGIFAMIGDADPNPNHK